MQQITLRLKQDTIESLDSEAEERGESRSEYVREVLDSRHEHEQLRGEYEEKVSDLQADLDAAEKRVEELRNELAAANRRIDSANELVEWAEETKSLEQRRAQAGIVTRAKWWVTGMPDEE